MDLARGRDRDRARRHHVPQGIRRVQQWGFGALVVVGYALSFSFMALSLKQLNLGSTYAIWSGSGTAATAVIGVALFGEAMTVLRIVGLVLIVSSVVVLSLGGAH